MLEVVRSCETSVYSETTQRYIPEGSSNLHTCCHENLNSHSGIHGSSKPLQENAMYATLKHATNACFYILTFYNLLSYIHLA
jgi:hypothetical protein